MAWLLVCLHAACISVAPSFPAPSNFGNLLVIGRVFKHDSFLVDIDTSLSLSLSSHCTTHLQYLNTRAAIMGVKSPAAMEVPADKFLSNLASVIPAIADAKFVVIDLEMSGINPPSIPRISKPTMEEIYQRAREATNTFCMLQFGLTCIMEDETEGSADGISMLSHNYHVSPMFNDRWDKHARSLAQVVDRTLTISYDTLIFLKKNCVRIEDVYLDGVTYLSRAEEAAATPRFLPSPKTANERRDGVDLENADEETQVFFKFVQSTIKTWADNPDNVSMFVLLPMTQGSDYDRLPAAS